MARNQLTAENRHYLNETYKYHPPKEDQAERYEEIRTAAQGMAMVILELTPKSREQSLALTNLEQAIMWANASIARTE